MATILFAIKLFETLEHVDFIHWGVRPRSVEGVLGILTGPLVHGDWAHLWSNLTSFMALGVALLYFYKDLAYRVMIAVYLFSGAFVWMFGRESWHIGASGVVYGLATFLFFSGIIRQYIPLMAISLIVAFMYGSMIWGIFPLSIHLPYSWEAHLGGTIGGLAVALALRKHGPQKPLVKWEDEDIENSEDDNYWDEPDPINHKEH